MEKNISKRKSLHGQSTFVLYQGRAMWDRVEPLLSRLGHTVFMPNLPGQGTSLEDIKLETADSSAYKMAKLIEEIPGRVIIVGSSRGGVWNTLIGELIPHKIEKVVYVSAWLLMPGESGNGVDGSGRHAKAWHKVSDDGITVPMGKHPEPAPHHKLLISLEDGNHLWKYMSNDIIDILYKRVYPTERRWGTIRRYVVNDTLDKDIAYELQKIQAENTECEAVYEIDADHIPMLSAPEELAFVLNDIALR
jgi:pimeloyl-ACP methyl ester carboxylesterase